MDFNEAAQRADELVESAVGILNTPIQVPRFGGVSIAGPRRELERLGKGRDSLQGAIDTERNNVNTATERQKTAETAAGDAAANKSIEDQKRAQIVADQYQYFSKLFGVDIGASADIATLAVEMRKQREVAKGQLQEVQELQSVGFLDNPIEWLYNQVQLPSKIDSYNRSADMVNGAQSTIDASLKTAQDAGMNAERGVPTITAGQAASDAKKAKALADKANAVADVNLARTNVDFAVQSFSKDLAITNATLNTTQLELSNAQQSYQAQVTAINLADSQATRQLKAAELLNKLSQQRSMDAVFINFDRITGHPEGTTNRYTFERMPKAHQENVVAIAAGSIGAGPFTSIENFIAARPGKELSPETNKFFRYIFEQSAQIDRTQIDPTAPKEARDQKLDGLLSARIRIDQDQASKPGSMFYELEPSKMIASGAIPANSRLAKALEPFTKQTGPVPTEVIAEAISKEWGNPTEAGQVMAEYYRANMKLRNTSLNANAFGIKMDTNYPVRAGSMFAPKFDLTVPSEATKYIIFRQSPILSTAELGVTSGIVGAATGGIRRDVGTIRDFGKRATNAAANDLSRE